MEKSRENELEILAVEKVKWLQATILRLVWEMAEQEQIHPTETSYVQDRIRFLIGHL